MHKKGFFGISQCAGVGLVLLVAGCAAPAPVQHDQRPAMGALVAASLQSDSYPWLNRLTWGATSSAVERNAQPSFERYLGAQLHPPTAQLPQAAQSQIQAMTISQRPFVDLVQDLEQQRKEAEAQTGDDDKKAAQQSYQQTLNRLAKEAATRPCCGRCIRPISCRSK